MSRGGRDDQRSETRTTPVARAPERSPLQEHRDRIGDAFSNDLNLPRGQSREPVEFRGHAYTLNGDEARALATVGSFRVVDVADIDNQRPGDWRHLREQGLVTEVTLTNRVGAHHVVSLTRTGKDLLEAHAAGTSDGRRQAYYSDVVKPRELAHDARLYAVFKEEARRIEREGGRVTRVVLDHELKRDYQRFLNRRERPVDTDLACDRLAFAEAHGLTVVKGHLELPDLRIEYQTEDGRLEHRDVELVTEHYSRGQLAGKARAGFACYRAGGQAGQTRTGGSPFNPRHMERL